MKVKGRHCKPDSHYWTAKRIVSAVLSVALLMGCISFSALAWFRYEKRTNIQVFKGTSLEVGFIGDKDTTYPLIPGQTYQLTGDAIPKITLPANSVNCYIYVLCEFYWYDLKYDVSGYATAAEKQQHLYGYPLSSMYRETDVAHDPFNDTYRPNREDGTAQGNDDDHGYTDYFGFQPDGSSIIYSYDTDVFLSLYDLCDIKDANGNIIGRRHLFGYRTTDNEEVFEKSASDRFFYVLEGNSKDCKFTVNEFITKEQAAAVTSANAPKMVFTGIAVQSDGVSRNDATRMIAEALQDGTLKSGILR